jgi:hypothetical protein
MQSGLRLALLKPAALPVTPLPEPPLSLMLLLKCFLCLVFVVLFKLFIAWQCSLVLHFVRGDALSLLEELWCTDCRLCPRLQEV